MSVIRTDEWLDKDFDRPEKMCRKIKQGSQDPEDFYRYLQTFGMYRSSVRAKQIFLELKKAKAWDKISAYEKHYRKLWKGPEIDIYIFPIRPGKGLRFRPAREKSGLTLENAVFLFLAPVPDMKEWEALFVHEYHHAARMAKLKKPLSEYTLLDSIVFEGLAEHAVQEYCGAEYVSETSRLYTEQQKMRAWRRFFSENREMKKSERMHDQLLFGRKFVPNMMGYALGFFLISQFKKDHDFSTLKYLSHPSDTFLTKRFIL
ncbi:DUF2268 domain-containing protein [Heyndrickxia acidiproducens]|uniref:DUF2268 domain-containing protein n=1 Tax=Heyndrickxia acidiproducens TaxID=1121084 RepID=UPI0003738CC5|nr:DUF2268 domain-containing putative Zn-dependent protease [Heyndrickxia acidiproducens]